MDVPKRLLNQNQGYCQGDEKMTHGALCRWYPRPSAIKQRKEISALTLRQLNEIWCIIPCHQKSKNFEEQLKMWEDIHHLILHGKKILHILIKVWGSVSMHKKDRAKATHKSVTVLCLGGTFGWFLFYFYSFLYFIISCKVPR